MVLLELGIEFASQQILTTRLAFRQYQVMTVG